MRYANAILSAIIFPVHEIDLSLISNLYSHVCVNAFSAVGYFIVNYECINCRFVTEQEYDEGQNGTTTVALVFCFRE